MNKNDQPRLAFYQGYVNSNPHDYLYYLWCNSNCSSSANWSVHSVGRPQYDGQNVDLAFDSQDHPVMAYTTYLDGTLNYSWCTANCESASPTWNTVQVEAASDIPPASNESGCSQNFWYFGGQSVSLALDAGDDPRIAYDAYNLQGGTCTVHEDIRLVRFALFPKP